MTNPYTPYRKEKLEDLSRQDRGVHLKQLTKILVDQLSNQPTQEQYFAKVEQIIASLREAGYDLWLHDYDGHQTQVWGWNYMHSNQTPRIQITFTWTGNVQIDWQDIV